MTTGFHLEQSSGRSADKFYRLYALGDGTMVASYGPRGRSGTAGPTVRHSPSAVTAAAHRAAQAKRTRGYELVVHLDFPTPPGAGGAALDVGALDAAFDQAWLLRDRASVAKLAVAAAGHQDRAVVRLPYFQGPRGRGGHSAGRPWGSALSAVVDANPSHYDPATRTTTAVVPRSVAHWVDEFYPGLDDLSAALDGDVDERALTALVPQLMGTDGLRRLCDAVNAATLALG